MDRTSAPDRLGPYRIEGLVARGGMGAVYRARRDGDGALVALKVLEAPPGPAGDERRRRFQRESQLAASLQHPGIVRVHAVGEDGRRAWFSMDLIDGAPLSHLVGRVDPREAARLVAAIARAIEHAHARGVVHRDLKPTNVLVRRDDGRPVVTDFGVARAVEGSDHLTRTGALVGTPAYMAPEQVTGEPVGPAADVHALGAILYELVTGTPPFASGELVTLAVAIAHEQPAPPSATIPSLPAGFDEVCLAALRKAPAARPSAGELAAALEALSEDRRPPPLAQRGALAPLAAAAALVLVLLVAVAASRGDRAPAPAPTAPATLGEGAAPPSQAAPAEPVRDRAAAPAETVPDWAKALLEGGAPSADALARALDEVDERPPPAAAQGELLAALRPLRRDGEALMEQLAGPSDAPVTPEKLSLFECAVLAQALSLAIDPAIGPGFAARWTPWTDLVLGPVFEGKRGPMVGEAVVRLRPDDVNAYVLLGSGTRWGRHDALHGGRPVTRERHLGLLLRGVRLAAEHGESPAWTRLVATCAVILLRTARAFPEERARAEARLSGLLEAPAPPAGELGFAHVHGARAELRMESGRLDAALEDLDRAVALAPAAPHWRAWRASLRLDSASGPEERARWLDELRQVWDGPLPAEERRWLQEAEAITEQVAERLERQGELGAATDLRWRVARHALLLAPILDRLAAAARAGLSSSELERELGFVLAPGREWIPNDDDVLDRLRRLRWELVQGRSPPSMAPDLERLADRLRR